MSKTDKTNNKNQKSNLKIKSWYSNRYQIVVVQRNILLLFTLVSMFSVAIAVIFVKNVMSSKSLEPYVIQVENKSGVATVVDQLTAQNFTGDKMIRKYFVNQFVHAATGYDPKSYKKDALKVRLLSTSDIFSDFRSRIRPRVLGVRSNIDIRIKSIQFTDGNNAQIRLVQQENIDDKIRVKDLIINMGFYFSPNMKLTMEERLINPLGFQVNKYLIADEVFNY